jgi:hypothetical protein
MNVIKHPWKAVMVMIMMMMMVTVTMVMVIMLTVSSPQGAVGPG